MEDRDMPERQRGRYSDDEMRPSRRYSHEDDEPRPRRSDNKQQLISMLISVILSFLVVYMWANNTLVTRNDFGTNLTNITNDMGKIQDSIPKDISGTINALSKQVSTVTDKLDAVNQNIADIKSSLGSYVKSDTLAQTNSSLTDIQNKLNNLQSQVNNFKQVDTSGLSSSIDTLKTQVANLQTQVTALQQPSGTSGSSSQGIQVSIKTLGNNSLYPINKRDANNKLPGDEDYDSTTVSSSPYDGVEGSFRLTLTNTTNVDISDATVDIQLSVYPSLPSYTPTLSGGGVPWYREYSDSQNMEFYNGAWGLSVPANQSINITFTLTCQGVNSSSWNLSGGYYFQLQANVS